MTVLENNLETQLTEARETLTALKGRLPEFRTAVTDAAAKAHRLKTEGAALSRQTQARAEATAAQELLAEHAAEIAAAQGRVTELEALERRELILAKMATHAQRTTKHRRELEQAVHEGSEVLGRVLTTMAHAFAGIREERAAFALLGRDLEPELPGSEPFNGSIQENEKQAACNALLSELEARGATLTDVINNTTGTLTRVDRETRPLPSPEHSELLWRVFSETVVRHQQFNYLFHRLYLPVKPHGENWQPVTTSSDNA